MRLVYGMWLTSFLLGLWIVHTCSAALPNGAHDFDDFSAQEQANHGKSPHGNRVFNRAIRGPQNNAAAPRISAQTKTPAPQKTSTSPPVQPEADKDVELNAEEQEKEESNPSDEAVSSTTTSTEPPKRTVGGVVRPFRSNKDLLESLKRRRQMQAQNGYTVVPPASSTSTTEKPQAKINHQNNRKTSVANKGPVPSADQTSVGSQKKSTANRRYNAKVNNVSSTTTPVPQAEAIAEESNVATQSSRSRTYPKTRRTR